MRALSPAMAMVQEHAVKRASVRRDRGGDEQIIQTDTSCGPVSPGDELPMPCMPEGEFGNNWGERDWWGTSDIDTWSSPAPVMPTTDDGWNYGDLTPVIPAAIPPTQEFFPDYDFTWNTPQLPPVEPETPFAGIYPEETVVAMNDVQCVYGPFTVCIVGKRPPPPTFDDYGIPAYVPPAAPATTGCGFFKIFCSWTSDREPEPIVDNSDAIEAAKAECTQQYIVEMDVCGANRAMGADYRTWRACTERAGDRQAACIATANRTGRGRGRAQ